MPDEQVSAIQAILTEADKLIRQRFEEQNIDSDHMLLAVTPDGAGIIRSSCGPEQLKFMSEMIADIADEVEEQDDEDSPRH